MKKLLSLVSILAIGGSLAYGAACVVNLVPPTTSNQICSDTGSQMNFIDPVAGQVTLNNIANPASGNFTTQLKVSGTTVLPPTSQSVSASALTPISPTATYLQLVSTGAVTFSTTLAITTGTATSGQYLLLDSTASISNISITTGTATGVVGDNATIIFNSTYSAVGFIYNAVLSQWKEVGKQ